jgi:hypothetical protein
MRNASEVVREVGVDDFRVAAKHLLRSREFRRHNHLVVVWFPNQAGASFRFMEFLFTKASNEAVAARGA